MPRLAEKTAIVTGGAKGIGRHYSQALAAEGARVMIADIADGTELAEEIAGRHGANSVASAKFDVSDEKQVQRLVGQTLDRFGQIDILVNNAALYAKLKPRNLIEWDGDTWDRVMAINVRGPFLMVKHVAPHNCIRSAVQGCTAHVALCDIQGCDAGLHTITVARTWRIRHCGQFALTGLYPERHGP
jgi:NAD(P)-dependent dehydrogenase (short-subunit alcohol dehydrogenase family)